MFIQNLPSLYPIPTRSILTSRLSALLGMFDTPEESDIERRMSHREFFLQPANRTA